MGHDGSADCIFCQIASRAAPAHVVYEDAIAVAFLDRTPLFHGHTLVVPRSHVVELRSLPADVVGPFFRRVQLFAEVIPAALEATGTFVAMNNIVSQSVAHLHTHVVPRVRGDGLRGFFWPRTTYADGEAEAAGDRIRAALAGFTVEAFLSDR